MAFRVALIGFGEAASTLVRAGQWGASACAFDIRPTRQAAMRTLGVVPSDSAAAAVAGAPLVLSLVTADQSLHAARRYAPHMTPGSLWCDMNSVAPDTKREAASAVAAAGACYVDAAILAPVNPAALRVPVLLSGAAADAMRAALADLGFTDVRVVGAEVGRASATKMIRSVMVKGIEALTAEMMQAAEAAGVTDDVLASLDASEKVQSWAARAAYNLERMANHGLRRAAEMEEAANTLAALGVEPVMTHGTIRHQRAMAGRAVLRDPAE